MFKVGQKIEWITIIDGSIEKVYGEVLKIHTGRILCEGKTLHRNEPVKESLSIYNKTIEVYR